MEEYRKKDDRGRSKAARLTKNDPHQKVDSSTWTPDAAENAGIKTGARPLVKRLFKKGGKVVGKCEGGEAMRRADRKPRKAGGRTNQLTPDSLINRDVRTANEVREGVKHEGAFKKGGKAGGGMIEASKKAMMLAADPHRKTTRPAPQPQPPVQGQKRGGRAHKLGGGMLGNNPVSQQDMMNGKASGAMKKGGRAHHATDGKVPMPIPRPAGMDYPDGKVPMPSRRPVSLDAGNMTPDQVNVAQKSVDKGVDPYGDGTGLVRAHKRGGKVHPDEAADKALIKRMVKPEARTGRKHGGNVFEGNSMEKIPGVVGGRHAHAKGGRTKGTTVNIIMARGHDQQQNMPNAPMLPPKPPVGVPVPPPGMAGGAPQGMPPQMPPQGMPRKSGGRTGKFGGGAMGTGAPHPAMGMGMMGGQLQGNRPMPMGGTPMSGAPLGGVPMGGNMGNMVSQQNLGGTMRPNPVGGGVDAGMPVAPTYKRGGRTSYPIETGSGGGEARMDKIKAYGLKPPRGK